MSSAHSHPQAKGKPESLWRIRSATMVMRQAFASQAAPSVDRET